MGHLRGDVFNRMNNIARANVKRRAAPPLPTDAVADMGTIC
jgi:hypothetical protein